MLADRYFWLGANDKESEGNFAWISGAPWGYENWKDANPDDWNGEDCLHTYWRSGGAGWNDWGCGNTGAYLCQINPIGIIKLSYFLILGIVYSYTNIS
jgi:hypothetical protein